MEGPNTATPSTTETYGRSMTNFGSLVVFSINLAAPGSGAEPHASYMESCSHFLVCNESSLVTSACRKTKEDNHSVKPQICTYDTQSRKQEISKVEYSILHVAAPPPFKELQGTQWNSEKRSIVAAAGKIIPFTVLREVALFLTRRLTVRRAEQLASDFCHTMITHH